MEGVWAVDTGCCLVCLVAGLADWGGGSKSGFVGWWVDLLDYCGSVHCSPDRSMRKSSCQRFFFNGDATFDCFQGLSCCW